MKKQPRAKLAKSIADQTLKNGLTQPFSKQIAAYLISEHRVNELSSVLRDVQADWADAGYVEVIASSAHPLTAHTKTEVKKQIDQLYPASKEVVVTEEIDPKVIGGVRLSLANQQLDLSVEAKLNKLTQLTSVGGSSGRN